jgi:uncharacterized MAPEG superfamily protein
MEPFAPYSHAIVSMAGFALFGLLINPLTAVAKMRKGHAAGGTPAEDYADPVYRFNRAYLNITETMGFFLATTVAAILAGVDPAWVNWLASIFLVSRLLVAVVHIGGIPPQNFGPRTFLFVVGWLCCVINGVLAIGTVF